MANRRQLWTTVMSLLAVIVLLVSCSGGATSETSNSAAVQGGASNFAVEPGKAPPPPSDGKSYSDAEWAKIVDAAKKEGTVMHYGNYGDDYDQKLIDGFKKAYGINLQIVAGTTNVLAERVKTEYNAGVYQVDTIWGQGSIQNAELKDKLAPIDVNPVFRNANDLSTWYVNPLVSPVVHQTHAYPHCGMLTINTNVVPPDKYPKKFQDLLDPFFKGKIMMDDPMTSITPDTTLWSWWVGLGFAEGYLDTAYDLYNKNSGYVQIGTERDLVQGQTGVYPAMRGTTGATPQFYAETQSIKNLKVLNFADQPIACGSTIMMGNSVFAKAPHPNAARVYSNWFIGQDGQSVWTQARAVGTIRKDVPNPIKETYWPQNEATQYYDINIDYMNFMNEEFSKKIMFNLMKQGMSRDDFKAAMKQVSMDHFKQFPPTPFKLYSADDFYKGTRK